MMVGDSGTIRNCSVQIDNIATGIIELHVGRSYKLL